MGRQSAAVLGEALTQRIRNRRIALLRLLVQKIKGALAPRFLRPMYLFQNLEQGTEVSLEGQHVLAFALEVCHTELAEHYRVDG